VLGRLPRQENPNVLVGFDKADDAGVYRLNDSLAIVETVDFFTPIVDDPETFGMVAAANALSDVYAMGGKPVTALAVACFPAKGDPDILEQIMRGGLTKINEAGCVVIGGHSVADDEIKFGYAVIGLIDPSKIRTNSGARPGDDLVLTKRLGTGVISTALKRGMASDEHVAAMVESMLQLNAAAGEAISRHDVHAATDITGFGLLGHGREMAQGSDVGFEIDHTELQFLPGAIEYAEQRTFPGGQKSNKDFAECMVAMNGSVPEHIAELLYDPQTSGGLLISIAPEGARSLMAELEAAGVPVSKIGKVTAPKSPRIDVY
jgi:selenide,water dikinase